MGMLDRIKGITPYANSGQLKPRRGAAPDTHTVRDDSGNTTAALTERIAAKTSRENMTTYQRGRLGMAPLPRERVKIGSEVTTWHEPKSPEGKAILKDKAGKAKALKKVNKEYGKEYGKDDTVQARSESYDRAKKDEAQWGDMAGPGSPSQTYKEGGSKAEIAKNQSNNRQRIQNEKDGYK